MITFSEKLYGELLLNCDHFSLLLLFGGFLLFGLGINFEFSRAKLTFPVKLLINMQNIHTLPPSLTIIPIWSTTGSPFTLYQKKIELESHHHSSSFHRWTKGQSWNINLLSYNWKNCVAFRTTYFNWFGPLFALVQILLALQIVIKRFARAKLNEILFHMSWVTRNQRPSGNVVLDHFCIIHCPFVWLMTHESWVISARDLFRLRNWKWR